MVNPKTNPTTTDQDISRSISFPRIALQCALVSMIAALLLTYILMFLFFTICRENFFSWIPTLCVSFRVAVLASLFSFPLGVIVVKISKPVIASLTGFFYFLIVIGPFTQLIYHIIFHSLHNILGFTHPLALRLHNYDHTYNWDDGRGNLGPIISPTIGFYHFIYTLLILGFTGAVIGGIVAIYKRDRLNSESQRIVPRFFLSELFFGFSLLAIIFACLTMIVRYPI